MKTFIALFMSALILFGSFGLVMAQEPTAEPTTSPTMQPIEPPPFPVEVPETLPETAAQGVDVLALAFGALAGLIGKYLTNGIKALPFLSEGEKSKLDGSASIFLAAVVSIATGYALSYAGVAANWLDSSGVWQVLVTAWPWAYKFYMDSRNQSAKAK